MYINNLGMGHEVNNNSSISSNSKVNSNSETAKTSTTNTSKTSTFPTTLTNALKSQGLTLDENSDTALSISEALERLKSDPEWEDVGTALSALYKNQQTMQAQMSLLSVGYTSGLTGLSSAYSQYGGLGTLLSSTYGSGNSGNLLSNSIFGSFLS